MHEPYPIRLGKSEKPNDLVFICDHPMTERRYNVNAKQEISTECQNESSSLPCARYHHEPSDLALVRHSGADTHAVVGIVRSVDTLVVLLPSLLDVLEDRMTLLLDILSLVCRR